VVKGVLDDYDTLADLLQPKDERREEIADAGEVARDKWYTGSIDY